MKTFTSFLVPILLLSVGLWACQDQVVTPDANDLELEAAFAKPPKPVKPSRTSMWVGFASPDAGHREGDPFVDSNLDISAGAQLIDVIVDEYGELQIPDSDYELSLHFQDELDNVSGSFENWCESEVCDRSGCGPPDPGEEFNLLQELQNALALTGQPLTGRLVFSSTDRGGINFETTLEVAGTDPDFPYRAGEYVFHTCWLNCGAREHGIYTDGTYLGLEYWFVMNSPVSVEWRELGSKKNDPWTHRTSCGSIVPGENRGGSYEFLGSTEGGW